jgi:hypothetical protein
MSKRKDLRLLAGWLLVLMPIVAFAVSEVRFAISEQRVAEALNAAGVPAMPSQVKFLSRVSSAVQNSDLEVMHVSTWGGETVKVELRCHDHRACLPFYVLLRNARAAQAHGQSSTSQTASSQRAGTVVPIQATQVIMRNGDPATLVFEDNALRITMPVICLESGGRGQKIRVVSTDHKRYFKAEIVQAGLLRASL